MKKPSRGAVEPKIMSETIAFHGAEITPYSNLKRDREQEEKKKHFSTNGFLSSVTVLALLLGYMGYTSYTSQEKPAANSLAKDSLYYNQLYTMYRSDTNYVGATIKAVSSRNNNTIEYLNLVNGATPSLWYQFGVSYLPERHEFRLVYNVWKDNRKMLSSDDGSEIILKKGIKEGDTVSLSLSIKVNSISMEAKDFRTGETATTSFPTLEHTFKGGLVGNGAFTGIMSEEISKFPIATQPYQDYMLEKGSGISMDMKRLSIRLVPIEISESGKKVSGYRIIPLVNSGINDEYLTEKEFVTGSR